VKRRARALLACTLSASTLIAGCGRDVDDPDSSVPATGTVVPDTTALVADPAPDATVENTVRDVSEGEAEDLAGSATLTIGDRTWTFSGVACLFDDAAAQVDAAFALSSVVDGSELYAQISAGGHVITIVDVARQGGGISLTTTGGGRFIRVSGNSVSATADFVPVENPSAPAVSGTLRAECAAT
jgi:predicted small secreted protein